MDQPGAAPPPDLLATPLRELRGVGPERAAQLARLGLLHVQDLLLHRPRRYEDRRQLQSIADARLHDTATFRGRIVALGIKRFARGRKSVFELILDDGTARLHCRWWNLPYMQNYFDQDADVLVFGKVINLKPRTIDHPETEVIDGAVESSIHLNRIAPVYPLTEGLPQRWLRALVWRALEEFDEAIPEPWPREPGPEFLTRRAAVQSLHFPARQEDVERARQRLALDELVDLQRAMRARRLALLARAEARPCPGDNRLIKPFLRRLGFQLTEAQTRVLRDLRADMGSGRPMRRLLQGDVGAGKTVVAACCALFAIEGGFNVALMAPTEILAEQHYRSFRTWFEPLGVQVHLQTGACKTLGDPPQLALGASTDNALAGSETTAPAALPRTPAYIAVGTHALIENSSPLDNLGLVIIDEQHRFGVAQRERLVRKGACPHLLVMTATPIPRTLGLTLYGDLDISALDALPGGRVPIRTFVRTAASLPKVWSFIRDKLTEGRQAFVVFPRVEDGGQGVKAVTQEYAVLQKELAPFQVGSLHGRLTSAEKASVLEAFHNRSLHVLLSTSLIEVGIDVPNASVMLVENADHFGLAQLHQLRGRIGRGSHESFCVLIDRSKSPEGGERLRVLAESSDGFEIAEADLKLRGPGDLLGQQQSGLPPLRFADLARDLPLVVRAREIAVHLISPAS